MEELRREKLSLLKDTIELTCVENRKRGRAGRREGDKTGIKATPGKRNPILLNR